MPDMTYHDVAQRIETLATELRYTDARDRKKIARTLERIEELAGTEAQMIREWEEISE